LTDKRILVMGAGQGSG